MLLAQCPNMSSNGLMTLSSSVPNKLCSPLDLFIWCISHLFTHSQPRVATGAQKNIHLLFLVSLTLGWLGIWMIRSFSSHRRRQTNTSERLPLGSRLTHHQERKWISNWYLEHCSLILVAACTHLPSLYEFTHCFNSRSSNPFTTTRWPQRLLPTSNGGDCKLFAEFCSMMLWPQPTPLNLLICMDASQAGVLVSGWKGSGSHGEAFLAGKVMGRTLDGLRWSLLNWHSTLSLVQDTRMYT